MRGKSVRQIVRKSLFAGLAAALLAGCNGEIYVIDGVTDGDTFYLSDRAFSDTDPVLQSWVAYSLARSVCQLEVGGENPARNSTFDCELKSRRILVDTWREQRAENAANADAYLDALADVDDAGFLSEYVARFHGRRHWTLPTDLDLDGFRHWRRDNLYRHRPQTRIVGSWNFARNRATY